MRLSQTNSIEGADNKRCFSANGFSLLPLALRPRLFCSVVLLMLVMTAIISVSFSGVVSATTSTLTLTVDTATLSLDLKPVSLEGTFARSSGSVNIGVNTNNSSGFTLKFAASTADDRTLSDGNGNGLSPIVTAVDADTFSGSDTTYNNKWGYLPSRMCTISNNVTTCTDNTTNYFPAPTTTGDMLDVTDSANASSATSDDSTYTIAIGARANTSTKATTYEGTFVITAVANPIPYTITYNKNTEDTVTNMPAPSSGSVTTEIATNAVSNKVPARTGYKFLGWCSTTTVVADNADTCSGTIYNPNGGGTNRNYTLDQTGDNTNIVLYAMWQEVHTITFTAGNNIDTIIVADGSNKWRPYYASGGASVSRTVPVGTKLAVTVVPVADYILDSWTSTESGLENRLASTALLTTTYIVGATDETLTATGVAADYTDPTKSYTAMKDFALSSCTVAGNNVTDSRDGKSYTVAKFGDYCYMLSNLRLDNTTDGATPRRLTSADSDITPNTTYTEFIMPTETWSSGSQNYYCKAIMKHYNQGSGNNYSNEYYYNWYAAKANPYQCDDPTTSTNATSINDGLALGSICPAGWKLPTYNEITAATLWDSGNNPGLVATSGNFDSGFQHYFGGYGYWWSSARSNNNIARNLAFRGASADLYSLLNKYYGFSVRCMRSS